MPTSASPERPPVVSSRAPGRSGAPPSPSEAVNVSPVDGLWTTPTMGRPSWRRRSNREGRDPVQVVDGAVERVDDPRDAGRARGSCPPPLDAVVRPGTEERSDDQRLAGPVDLGHEVGWARLDRRPTREEAPPATSPSRERRRSPASTATSRASSRSSDGAVTGPAPACSSG